MTEEAILKIWKSGRSKFFVANEYMKNYNKQAERKKEPKIKKDEALAYVEPIIFKYETKDWSK